MPSRPPIIVWLLLAATICANLVAFAWMRATSVVSFGTIVYFGLLSAQLSVVSIWAALRLMSTTWTLVVTTAAVIACSLAFGLIEEASTRPKDILPYFGLHAVLLLATLWVLRRSAFWRQRTGVETQWRFSIAHLLLLMTVIAILVTAMRHSVLFHEGNRDAATLLVASVALGLASVIIWSREIHWLLRFAGVLGVAMGIGAVLYVVDPFLWIFATTDSFVQAIMLSAWLAWGQILPPNDAADAAKTTPPTGGVMQ